MALRLTFLVSYGFHVSREAMAVDPNPQKFLIATSPVSGKVSYVRLPRGDASQTEAIIVNVLIDTGLVHPQGLAVDQKAKRLLVADPDSKSIFSYDLKVVGDVLIVGAPKVAAADTEARWVAVDGVGNMYFSDEPKNQILKIASAQALRANTTPTVLYDGSSLAQVSAPGGIATDSFSAYWVNKQIGTQVGSIVKGAVLPDISDLQASVTSLSRNTDKSYGVCLALNNVFYTQPEKIVYAVKKGGSDTVPITDRLTNPRGCAWDGDGSVFIADRGANAIYSFAANMQALSTTQLTKIVDLEDAFGVAVFSQASGRPSAASGLLGIFMALAALVMQT